MVGIGTGIYRRSFNRECPLSRLPRPSENNNWHKQNNRLFTFFPNPDSYVSGDFTISPHGGVGGDRSPDSLMIVQVIGMVSASDSWLLVITPISLWLNFVLSMNGPSLTTHSPEDAVPYSPPLHHLKTINSLAPSHHTRLAPSLRNHWPLKAFNFLVSRVINHGETIRGSAAPGERWQEGLRVVYGGGSAGGLSSSRINADVSKANL